MSFTRHRRSLVLWLTSNEKEVTSSTSNVLPLPSRKTVRNYWLEGSLSTVLKSEIGHGAIKEVLRGTLKVEASTCVLFNLLDVGSDHMIMHVVSQRAWMLLCKQVSKMFNFTIRLSSCWHIHFNYTWSFSVITGIQFRLPCSGHVTKPVFSGMCPWRHSRKLSQCCGCTRRSAYWCTQDWPLRCRRTDLDLGCRDSWRGCRPAAIKIGISMGTTNSWSEWVHTLAWRSCTKAGAFFSMAEAVATAARAARMRVANWEKDVSTS